MSLTSNRSSYFNEVSFQFFNAIKDNNANEVVTLIRKSRDNYWEFTDDENFSGLHRAAFLNFNEIISSLISELKKTQGADSIDTLKVWVNARNNQGYTALHYASYRGNIEMIKLLIENFAELEVVNNRGINVMHFAASGNQPASLVYFKDKHQMNINSQDEMGSTALHWACYNSSESALDYLLSCDIDVDYSDKEGLTALHLAVNSDNIPIIKKLLRKGANKDIRDNKGKTPFQIAFDKKKNEIVKIFTEHIKCQMCAIKQPYYKVEKSSFNIFFFLLMHVVIESLCFFVLVPFLKNMGFSCFYLILLVFILVFFFILICRDPSTGNDSNKTFLELIEEKVDITKYCSTCIVEKKPTMRHCLICDRCIDGFDFHCYWVNNCIGAKNFKFYVVFLLGVMVNLIYNFIISIFVMSNASNKEWNEVDKFIKDSFPSRLGFINVEFYEANQRTVTSVLVLISSVVFMVPVFFLIVTTLKKKVENKRNSVKDSKRSGSYAEQLISYDNK